MAEATIGGSASYVELLICLEMARDVDKEDINAREPAKAGVDAVGALKRALSTSANN